MNNVQTATCVRGCGWFTFCFHFPRPLPAPNGNANITRFYSIVHRILPSKVLIALHQLPQKVLLFCTVLRADSLCLHAKTAETRSNLCRVYHIFFFLQLTVPGTSPLPPAFFRSRIRYRAVPVRYESLRWHSEPLPLRYGTVRQPNRNRTNPRTLHRWHP